MTPGLYLQKICNQQDMHIDEEIVPCKSFEERRKKRALGLSVPHICKDGLLGDEISSFLGLTLLSTPPHALPLVSILGNNPFNLLGSDDGTGLQKRLRRTTNGGGGGGGGGGYGGDGDSCTSGISTVSNGNSNCGSLNSVKRLQFRDHVWTYNQRFLAAEAVEESIITMEDSYGGEGEEEGGGGGDGMRLVHILIACAEAVACRDRQQASALLYELRSKASAYGTSFQRVAYCFVQGLADRLTLIQPLGMVGMAAAAPTAAASTWAVEEEEKKGRREEALHLVYEVCPHIQFGHFVANSLILEAFEGESSVHVVDLGMTSGLPHGHQWRRLINSLATRSGQPLHRLRITGVGPDGAQLHTIGHELKLYARSLNTNFEFEFMVVESNLESLKPENCKLMEGEALVVNSILQLHCAVKESRGALNAVLQIIHGLSPKVLVLVEQDSSHNGPFFLGRFMEALHYYSAIFDSLDAMLPKCDTRRVKMEQFYFAEEIKNIVSCEGPARVERHERVDQWRRRMSRAGFQPSPIKMMNQAEQWLVKVNVNEGYTLGEEKGCLVLGWKSKPIVAASCWKC